MLNGNDIQLFYRLLDSLSNSLRDLAVKYELLLKESTEREKVASAVTSIAKEISSTFASMSKDMEALKSIVAEDGKRGNDIFSSVQTGIKAIENLDAKAGQILRDLNGVSLGVTDVNTSARHLDIHADETGRKLGELLGISQKMTDMIEVVEQMKKDFVPIKRLGNLLSQPVAIVVGIYIIITTAMAIMKGCDEYRDMTKKHEGTTNVVATAGARNSTP